jgi:lactate 2-monooxygenase
MKDAFLVSMEAQKAHYSYEDWEQAAKAVLAPDAFGYIQSGAGAEETLSKNELSFRRYSIVPRYLRNVSEFDYSIELFGDTLPYPVLLAPVGMQGIAHPEGDLASARAAGKTQVGYVASTVSSFSLEDIARSNSIGVNWFQLYWSNDRNLTLSMVKRAERAGYKAIVVTVDTVTLGWRETDLKNKYSPLRLGYGKANYVQDSYFQRMINVMDFEQVDIEIAKQINHPSLSWEDLVWLKEHTSLPIVLKGILHEDDAKLAVEKGFDGIIVSNHGGRQLDGCGSALSALPGIVKVVPANFPVLLDSGIRRGADIVKAVALGADAVLVGRPYVYGLAVAGEKGVKDVIETLLQEFKVSATLAGARNMEELKSIRLMLGDFV